MLEHELFRRRDLPHWDVPGAFYFVTSCLEGSIPACGLLDVESYAEKLKAQKRPSEMTAAAWKARCWKLTFARADQWLDLEPAIQHLRDPILARIVMDAFLHFAGERYTLSAFVVMPSHFHWVCRPRAEWVASLEGSRSPRERIMQSVKGYTARQCNAHLGAKGSFWQEESYDHWTQELDELERIIHYIEYNPVRAGLCTTPEEWPFSSARLQRQKDGTLLSPT